MAKQPEQSERRVSPIAVVTVALILIAVATFAVLQKNRSRAEEVTQTTKEAATPQPSAEQEQAAPENSTTPSFRMPKFLTEAQLAILQPTKDPNSVNAGAMAAYQVAQQKPKLLAQLPCFCYCDRFGHGSLHDCYVSNHAETCDICLKEALQADQLDSQGIPINQIRDAIVAQFHPREGEHVH